MNKPLTVLFFILGSLFGVMRSVSAQCNYTLVTENADSLQTYTMLGFSVQGLSRKNANRVVSRFDLYRGDKVVITKAFFTPKLVQVCTWKNYSLSALHVIQSVDGNGGVVLRLVYEEVPDVQDKKKK